MKITVFTPTYNRGYIIRNLYESLKRQTHRDFEWLVIDDGSTDETSWLFENYLREDHFFPIRYIKQKDGGKHRAINNAVKIAEGELFFIVDSDDFLTDNALQKIVQWETKLPSNVMFCGVSGLRGKNVVEVLGSTFEGVFCDASYSERKTFNINGDKAEVYYTSILKQFPFAEFENENFLTEATVWLEMGSIYKIRYFNEIIYICDYLTDGLSHNIGNIALKNPRGIAHQIKQTIKFTGMSFKQKLSAYYYYGKDYENILSKKEILDNLEISSSTYWFANAVFGALNSFRSFSK